MSEKAKDIHIRARRRTLGGHVHYMFFTRAVDQSTWANSGELTMRLEEASSFETQLDRVEFLDRES